MACPIRHVRNGRLPSLAVGSKRSGSGNVCQADVLTGRGQAPFPWPGLAGKMDPRPDHGEASYTGSGHLTGPKALITGGDSGIGRAIAYAREGADVAINYLPAEEPDAQEVVALIKKAGRKAVATPGDLREEAFCKKLVGKSLPHPKGS